MENYKPNSHRSKEEQKEATDKKVEKVVTNGAKVKKNEVRRFADIFLPGDISDVKSYIINEVVIPTIKDTIANAVEMLLFGEAKHSSRKGTSTTSRTSYTKYYEKDKDRTPSRGTRIGSRFDYDDIIVGSKGEAEAIFEQMEELIDVYGSVSVFDLYDMADLTPPYTSSKYGWTDIRGAEAIRMRNGEYILKLPKALALD